MVYRSQLYACGRQSVAMLCFCSYDDSVFLSAKLENFWSYRAMWKILKFLSKSCRGFIFGSDPKTMNRCNCKSFINSFSGEFCRINFWQWCHRKNCRIKMIENNIMHDILIGELGNRMRLFLHTYRLYNHWVLSGVIKYFRGIIKSWRTITASINKLYKIAQWFDMMAFYVHW